jgi:CHAT domain-containing protein
MAAAALRLTRAATTDRELQRLPGTALEGRAIAALLPPGAVDVLDGLNATRSNFLTPGLERYRLIHVATHGVVDTQVPQLSSLMLSTLDWQGRPIDGRVMAADFMTLRLSADVVVLSACDTALGKNVVGEGLVGLRYMILARGAHAVVASLWAVPDQVGARLMTSFYQSMIRDHVQASHALCSAMRELLASRVVDPALWAAFDLTLRDASV